MTAAINPEIVREIAGVVRGINPVALNGQLEGKGAETCVAAFVELQGQAANTIVSMLICVGQAASTIEGNGQAAQELAHDFSMSVDRFYRCVKAYKEIVLTRINRDGANAVWHLNDISWYTLAADAAKKLAKPALELLEYAESQKAEDPKYSVRAFMDHLDDGTAAEDEGSTTSLAAAFDRWLAKGSKFDDGVFPEWVAWFRAGKSPQDHLLRAENALVALQQAVTIARQELGAPA